MTNEIEHDPGAVKILQMIEKVDPADTAALDEIDARVWCWLHEARFKKMLHTPENYKHGYFSYYQGSVWGSKMIYPPIQYTRIRDALKVIRPEGWHYRCGRHFKPDDPNSTYWIPPYKISDLYWAEMKTNEGLMSSQTNGKGKTEELAELHAIIQAIAYERALK